MSKTKVDTTYVSKASLRGAKVAPRKARLVVDLIRGRNVNSALDVLSNCRKKTAPVVKKLLLSAVANASQQEGVELDELYVKRVWVDEGKVMKRFLPRAQGRATPLRKRSSHISLVLDELSA